MPTLVAPAPVDDGRTSHGDHRGEPAAIASRVAGVDASAPPRRPLVIRGGRRVRGVFDRLIGASSLIANDPVLDFRDFAWTKRLRSDWRAIRDEARAVVTAADAASDLAAIPPGRRTIAEGDRCRSFGLHGYGDPIPVNIARCPRTAAALGEVPGLATAFFSILAPGTHIPARRGVTKGLVTCHLGLVVPRGGDVRMRVADRVVRWSEGETLVFDDTYDHEVWNDADSPRVVLLIRFERPLSRPGRWVAALFMRAIRRSSFADEARTKLQA